MATVESVVKEIFALWEENEKRLAENAALAARLDELESQDWKGHMAHLHTMWHDLERRFDELEKQVGTFQGKIAFRRSSFAFAKQERDDLAARPDALKRGLDETDAQGLTTSGLIALSKAFLSDKKERFTLP